MIVPGDRVAPQVTYQDSRVGLPLGTSRLGHFLSQEVTSKGRQADGCNYYDTSKISYCNAL